MALRALARPAIVPRARLESGVELRSLLACPRAGSVALVKLGLCATGIVLTAASFAFLAAAGPAAARRAAPSRRIRPCLRRARSSAAITPAPSAPQTKPAQASETPPVAPPRVARRKIPAPGTPRARARAAAVARLPRPIPFSAGTRYGL